MVSSIPIIKAGVLDKFSVFIINLIHCRSHGMGFGTKQFQLLAVMGDEGRDTHCQIPDPFLIAGESEKPEGFNRDLPGGGLAHKPSGRYAGRKSI
jgi:hypothetical protein